MSIIFLKLFLSIIIGHFTFLKKNKCLKGVKQTIFLNEYNCLMNNSWFLFFSLSKFLIKSNYFHKYIPSNNINDGKYYSKQVL